MFIIYLIALALGKRKLFTRKNAEFVFFDSQQLCHAPAKTPYLSTQALPASRLFESDLLHVKYFMLKANEENPKIILVISCCPIQCCRKYIP